MIDFSSIPLTSAFGRVLRYCTRVIPKEATLPVVQGELRGSRWVRGAGVDGYWLGTYEIGHQRAIRRFLRPGDVFYDIGAHAGFFTLLASKIVGPSGRVVAFEPDPENCAFLRRHLALNRIRNAMLVQAAVSDRTGRAPFEPGENSSTGRLSATGKVSVRVVAIDDLVRDGSIPPPNVMKVDVEGSCGAVIRGARTVIARSLPALVLETNIDMGDEANAAAMLSPLGYVFEPLDGEAAGAVNFAASVPEKEGSHV